MKGATTKKSETLKRLLHGFGKESPWSAKNGRKKGRLIPIQTTAKSRRLNKNRGRYVSSAGRRRKDQKKTLQLIVSESGEILRHALPNQRKKKAQGHSLSNAVNTNRMVAKKH